jgi:hypothetical protein
VYGRHKTAAKQQETLEAPRGSDRLTLVDQYIALLLVVFTDAGLIDVRPDTTGSLLRLIHPLGSDISCPRTYSSINSIPKGDPPHRRDPRNSESPPAPPIRREDSSTLQAVQSRNGLPERRRSESRNLDFILDR